MAGFCLRYATLVVKGANEHHIQKSNLAAHHPCTLFSTTVAQTYQKISVQHETQYSTPTHTGDRIVSGAEEEEEQHDPTR
jgi:hypothetical protein